MADKQDPASKQPMMIEGYTVREGQQIIKQEPVDPEETNGSVTTTEPAQASQKIRELLRNMVENKGKELTVKNVVEDLLQKNEFILAQNNAQPLKPATRNVKPKASDQEMENHGSILQPKDPTATCTKDDIANINEALVELAVNEANDTNCDPDLVCSVGSRIILMTNQGQPLQMDTTCYWCNFCSYRSDKKDALLQHVMEHRFHCKYCKFQSFSRASVIFHCMQEHENFKETANNLKYCTYLPDFLQRNQQQKKRKLTNSGDAASSKKARTEADDEQLMMEVEEVNDEQTNNTSSNSPRTLTPRRTSARKSLPAPTKILPKPSGKAANTSSPKAPAIIAKPEPADDPGFPMITNVVSGQQAVNEATNPQLPTTIPGTPEPAKTAGPVTVSSGLCWNCGYCGFVTLSQAFLKIHLNAQHPGKAHKYVAMLVSSEDEMEKIKASDSHLIANPTAGGVVPSSALSVQLPLQQQTPKVALNAMASVKPVGGSQIEIDNAESDHVNKEREESEEEKKIAVSFKCAHCNFSSPQTDKVKTHLFQRHNGSVMYALDMKAVKLRQKRYVFFCMKTKCSFQTKEVEDFLEHCDECTPWLDGKERKDIDSLMVKSLDLTRQFIVKTAGNAGGSKDVRPEKAAEYGCLYCSYISNNNTRLKKHVLSNHVDKACIINDLQANKTNRKPSVYFCQHCLWETREGSELELHLTERHSDKPRNKPIHEQKVASPAPRSSPTPTTSQNKISPKSTKAIIKDLKAKDDSSKESTPESSNASQSEEEEETEDNDYTGIVGDAEYEKAMAEYIASEQPEEKKTTRGRPARSAALKCQIRVKSVKPPPLYKCMHCTDIYIGVKLMRKHLKGEHDNQPLRAIDVMKQEKKHPHPHFCFCPVEKCIFTASVATDVVNHAKNSHGIKPTDTDLVRISNSFVAPTVTTPVRGGRPSTAATGESYECLYCPTSKLFHSRRDMKKHLKENHATEDYIYRDCIARKLRHPSRFYMCHEYACDFTSEKQKDYCLHLLGHKKSKIFECPTCQWFTSNKGDVDGHMSVVHKKDKTITSLEIDLDLDSHGNLVKLVGGTVIKSEKQ